jgi:hypothetical protein
MERITDRIDEQSPARDELPPVADPVHHGNDDLPAPVDIGDEELGEVIEPEPVEDLTKW